MRATAGRTGGPPLPGQDLLTTDGVWISARHDPCLPDQLDGARQPADGTLALVLAHGFTGGWRRSAIRDLVRQLRQHAGVVSFDFRGHGCSGGRSTVGEAEVLDLAAAVRCARGLGYLRVVTIGWSMGAAVALRQAARAPSSVDAVIAVSGPSRWNYRGTRPMRRLHLGIATPPGRALLATRWHTRVARDGWNPPPTPPDSAAALLATMPVLLVHGDADDYLPAGHVLWLARAAPHAQLWIEPGFGHAESEAGPALVTRLARWARESTGPADGSARMPR